MHNLVPSFQLQWFEDYSWLHYDEQSDCVFCFTWVKALRISNALRTIPSNADAFVNVSYYNWEKALGTKIPRIKQTWFPLDEKSVIHHGAVTRYIVASSQGNGKYY